MINSSLDVEENYRKGKSIMDKHVVMVNGHALNKYDISDIKAFYDYTKKPNITTGDCWTYLDFFVGTDACFDGLNIVDGDTYNHFLPLDTVKKLEAKNPDYLNGLFNYKEAQHACKFGSDFPKALSLNQIREYAHKAVKKLSKISAKN